MVYLIHRRTARRLKNRAKRNRIYLDRIYATRNVLSVSMEDMICKVSENIGAAKHNVVHIKIFV